MIHMENKPTKKRKYSGKIQADSIDKIQDALSEEARRLKRLRPPVRLGCRVVRGGPLLNAITLYFLSLEGDVRERIARQFLETYEAMLRAEDEERQREEERAKLPIKPGKAHEPSEKGNKPQVNKGTSAVKPRWLPPSPESGEAVNRDNDTVDLAGRPKGR